MSSSDSWRMLEGELQGAKFSVAVPSKHDLDLTEADTGIIRRRRLSACQHILLHAHGCRPEGIALVADLDIETDACYKKLVEEEGWVIGMTSYRKEGLVVREAIWDLINLREFILTLLNQNSGTTVVDDGNNQDSNKKEEKENKEENDKKKGEEEDMMVVLEGESMGGAIVTFIVEGKEDHYCPTIQHYTPPSSSSSSSTIVSTSSCSAIHYVTFTDASGEVGRGWWRWMTSGHKSVSTFTPTTTPDTISNSLAATSSSSSSCGRNNNHKKQPHRFAGAVAIGAALLVENGSGMTFSHAPRLPILYLTNTDETHIIKKS